MKLSKDVCVGAVTIVLFVACFGLLGFALSKRLNEPEPTVEIKELCLKGIKHYYSKYYLIRIEDDKGKPIRCEG